MSNALALEILPTQDQSLRVYAVAELIQDEMIRARYARFIGSISLEQEAAIDRVKPPSTYATSLEAAQAAKAGNQQAAANVKANVQPAVIEAIYKAGHVTKTRTKFREDGSLIQHGQAMIDVYSNALRYRLSSPAMRRRLKAEALNGHRIEGLNRHSALDDYWLLEPSFYPDDMPEDESNNEGFFGTTKTGVLRASTVENGECIVESAFVAGVISEGAPRHDLGTGRKLYEHFGITTEPMTATDFLEQPLLIPKSLMPNGVIDIVKLFDEKVGDVFFGQDLPVKDYDAFVIECQQREARLESAINNVTEELIAVSLDLKTPIDAVQRLYDLVRRKVLEQATNDSTIDASVFGSTAAYFIEKARYLASIGEIDSAEQAINKAERYASVTMCGAGSCGLEAVELMSKDGIESQKLGLRAKDKNELLHDTKRPCPNCKKLKVHYDMHGNKACTNCSYRRISGKVTKSNRA